MHGRTGRVITVSSISHLQHAHIDYDSLLPGDARAKKSAVERYGQSKFVRGFPACSPLVDLLQGDVVFAFELARRAEGKIVSSAINPGIIRTPLFENNKPGFLGTLLMVGYAHLGHLAALLTPDSDERHV